MDNERFEVYSKWAFTIDERMKAQANYDTYEMLKEKYRICRTYPYMKEGESIDDYDIVVGYKTGYAHTLYTVYKNAPSLGTKVIALICDDGNLCFGYSIRDGKICVYTD